MGIRRFFIVICIFSLFQTIFAQKELNVQKEIKDAAKQYKTMLTTHQDVNKFPQSIWPDGEAKDMPSSWWCSGFFGGSLWYLYEFTHDTAWKNAATKWSMAVEKEKINTSTHDLGFMLYCPFGNGYRLTKNGQYKQIMLTGAASLASRFNPKYGVIKSWDDWEGYDYPVIIDNMMNLEFLFWAAKASGNKAYYDLCVTHADNTLKNHFRKDYSSYHVICYGEGGKVLAQKTHQGAADSSAWSRGQGWALYGYTVMYRETKQEKYLRQAEHVAHFILSHPNLPADKIPYWDFNAPHIPNEERDASAAAVMASGLLELSQYSKTNSKLYIETAKTMLESLASPKYKAPIGSNKGFILMHSVGAKPKHSEIDVPLVYADYYYLEALLRYDMISKKQNKSLAIKANDALGLLAHAKK
ncbi:glycoside hydrolase family 88 protein [Parasediminibacterium sp. JCM 36343]|uniref:glycoside hydrolase family 88 protein n=1 Tax=Parasediminibacterium sp. JCM 36343 TaxID=3374279 RepID=UPI00397B8F8A